MTAQEQQVLKRNVNLSRDFRLPKAQREFGDPLVEDDVDF